jgi:CRISPR-associated protein Csb2
VYSALVAAAYAGDRKPTEAEQQALLRLEAAPPPSIDCPAADVREAPDSFVPVNDPSSRVQARKGQSQGVLLPNRQVRQFPSAFLLGDPEVSLQWPIDVTADELAVLDGLAERLTHVGTSHSFAVATFETGTAFEARWVPRDDGGHYLRVPRTGRLDELDRLATEGYGTVRRPTPLYEVLWPYVPLGPAPAARTPSKYDWVALRLTDASGGADTAHTLGRALRRAVMSMLGGAAPPAVHGHDPQAPHVAWLPLPDVGHIHARGRVRGLGVALPLSMPADERAATLAALAKLSEVRLPDGQIAAVVASVDAPEMPIVLRKVTWTAASHDWSTVTPVVLDRPPKRQTPERVEAAIADSLTRAGFPRPNGVIVLGSSDFDGAPTAMDIPTRVPRFHARVHFDQALVGPVIAGRWKNFGIGLFRPTPEGLRG